MDKAVIPLVQDNSARLQLFALAYHLANFLWQLAPGADQGTDADDVAGEANPVRGQGRVARRLRELPAGRGNGAAEAVRGDSGADRAAAAGACPGLRSNAPAHPVRASPPCFRGTPGRHFRGIRGGAESGAAGSETSRTRPGSHPGKSLQVLHRGARLCLMNRAGS
jgi:hypothetical protein